MSTPGRCAGCWRGASAVAREALQEYLSAVGSHIRWRRARVSLLRELSDHISDQAAGYRAQGEAEDAALEKAVAEMGDPEEVGRELDRLHRPQNRWGVALTVLVLAILGMVLQQAACQAFGDAVGHRYYLGRQAFGVLAGCGVLLAVWFSDMPALLWRRGLAVGAIAALWLLPVILGAAFPISFSALGRWRPPVYFTLLLPVPYAALLCRLKGRGCATVFVCGVGAVLLPQLAWHAPSMTCYVIIAAAMLLVLTAAVWSGWFSGKKPLLLFCALLPALLALSGILYTIFRTPYLTKHISVFLDPAADPAGAVYLLNILRNGLPLELYTSVLNADLLLYAAAQLYGGWVMILAAVVTVLSALLLLRRIRRLQSRSGKLLALAAFWPLALQAVVYLIYNTGWFPSGPLSLPFLSYGVSFLVVDAALVGVLLSVFRMDSLLRDVASAVQGPPPRLPGRLTIPLGGGSLSIEYRRKTPGARDMDRRASPWSGSQ